jgi:hypothetical protein
METPDAKTRYERNSVCEDWSGWVLLAGLLLETVIYLVFSKGKSGLENWTMRAASGRPKNITSCPRACILRPKAVIGCKCPVSGMLRKPILIIYNSRKTVVTSGVLDIYHPLASIL